MTSPTKFTIACIQMSMDRDRAANMAKAEARVREAAAAGATVICLPELFTGWYFCQREDPAFFDQAEPVPGPTTDAMGLLARELGVTILASVFERRAAGLYHNTLATLTPDGSIRGLYRKMHIPDDPLFYEKYYFTPGDLGYQCVKTPHAAVGTLVCWDQWYPEAARLTALLGADVIFYPTAIGWHPAEKAEWGDRQNDAWETVMRGHAVANGVYIAAVNRVGHEVIEGKGLEFWGGSFIAGPYGEIIAKAGRGEEILYAECDRAHQETIRRGWPFLRDRRIDSYDGITKRYLA